MYVLLTHLVHHYCSLSLHQRSKFIGNAVISPTRYGESLVQARPDTYVNGLHMLKTSDET